MELEASAWLSRALHFGVRVLGVLTQVHVEPLWQLMGLVWFRAWP